MKDPTPRTKPTEREGLRGEGETAPDDEDEDDYTSHFKKKNSDDGSLNAARRPPTFITGNRLTKVLSC